MVITKKQDNQGQGENEDNTEALAREECSRLLRQLRLMENDKKAYLEESLAAINHQKKTIEGMEKENKKLEDQLASFKNKYNEERDEGGTKRIHKFVSNFKSLREAVAQQGRVISEVEKRLESMTIRIDKLKLKVDCYKTEELSLPDLDRKTYALNKKLETVTSQFDSVVADNCGLRKKIDETLRESLAVNEKCSQLEDQVGKGKSTIDDLVDQATIAYDQREEAVAKANALRERSAKEKRQYLLESSELNRIIRHEEKLLDFMNTKNKERTFLETEEQRLSRLEMAKEFELEEALEMYRINFETLLTSNSPDLQSLVEEYMELQHNNISRFNYINELNNEIENLQNEINSYRESIKTCSSETVERNQAKNAAILRQLGELEGLKSDYRQVRLQLEAFKNVMDEIVGIIERLFQITDFNDAAPVLELLGSQQDISSQNAILYLNILEHRIAEVLSLRGDDESGRVTPAVSKSPRPTMTKSPSDISLTLRPKIIVSERPDSKDEQTSEEDLHYGLVQAEPVPLTYSIMRDKILDATSIGSRSPTSLSAEDPKLAEDGQSYE